VQLGTGLRHYWSRWSSMIWSISVRLACI